MKKNRKKAHTRHSISIRTLSLGEFIRISLTIPQHPHIGTRAYTTFHYRGVNIILKPQDEKDTSVPVDEILRLSGSFPFSFILFRALAAPYIHILQHRSHIHYLFFSVAFSRDHCFFTNPTVANSSFLCFYEEASPPSLRNLPEHQAPESISQIASLYLITTTAHHWLHLPATTGGVALASTCTSSLRKG